MLESDQIDGPPRFRLFAACFAFTLGIVALFGWLFGHPVLSRVVPALTPMNPITGIALMLAAVALLLPRQRIAAIRLLAFLVAAIGAAKLAQLIWLPPLPFDQMVIADHFRATPGLPPGRSPPNTALSLVLIGAALFAGVSARRPLVLASQALAAAVLAFTALAMVNYVLDGVALANPGVHSGMSLSTALGLTALAAAILSLSPAVGLMRLLGDRGPAGLLARTALPFALLVPVLIGSVRLLGQRAGFYGTDDGVALQVFANIVVAFAVLAGCIVMLFRSDEARRRREQAIAQSEGQYRHAEQVGHIGHWQIDYPSGRVEWSDEFYAICGLGKSAVPSLEATLAMFHPEDAVVAREIVAGAIRDCREWEIGYRIRRPDGEVRHIKSHGVCNRDADGEVSAIFGVIVDVTELELARREAEAATASKAAFLANMSHEIRTPMNGVMGFVELLMDSDLDTSQRRHLLLIQESAQALLKLLNDILDLSKIEAGQLEVNPEPSDVRRDIAQCVRLMTPIAEQKGLELSAEIEGDFPARVMVDSLRLRQIVFNLLGNAVKFTNRGSVQVTLRSGLDARKRKTIFVGVSDTGVGIDPERKAAIFEAFVQADASISRRFGGSGLGLSISRRLARLMDGTISLESAEGEGTLVTLALPLKAARGNARRDDRLAPRADPIADMSPPRVRASILLVEDIDINQELISEMLVRLGHKVDIAATGAEALECARRLAAEPEAWDIILMDVQMPVMDGLTATRAIRALGGRAGTIPIVALTANAFAAEMQECRDAGMNDHVPKPSGFVQLKRVIDRWSGTRTPAATQTGFPDATPSLLERFEIRRLASSQRLTELIAELAAADPLIATAILREAESIAHVLAGTSGMFGQIRLGKTARQIEAELKQMGRDPATANASPALDRLVAALDASPQRPDSPRPLAA